MSKKRPNVIIILSDDQGYGDFGCHGNPSIHTPALDKLYTQSVHLTDFHMAPTCAPARAGLLSGQYNDKLGVWHTVGGRSIMRLGVPTMGDVFRAGGYATACFGKWHLGDSYPYRAIDRGFDEVVIHRGGGIGQTPDYWGNDYFENSFEHNGVEEKYEGYCTDVFFRLTKQFAHEHKDEPFFIYLAPNAPHYPLRVEQRYYDMYKGKMPDNRARCYGMLSNIDDNVAMLRDYLREEGLEDDTIFIYSTDNGGEFGFDVDKDFFVTDGYNAGMRGRKATAYEGGHRVPCFISCPALGLDKARDIDDLTVNMDLMPTLMELCGIEEKVEGLDGRSIAPLLAGEAQSLEEHSYIVDSQRMAELAKWKTCVVMRGKWRLIDGRELYDLSKDPEQRHDISAEHEDVVQSLRADYEAWWTCASARAGEEIPIHIGSEQENPVFLSSHDWRGSEEQCVWNQGEVRRALRHNSYLEIYAEREGTYTFELRRWPREADLAICEGIPGRLGDYSQWYDGGVALDIVRAAIEADGERMEKEVAPGDKYVSFTMHIKQGAQHIQTYFYERDGGELGAYYTYALRHEE